MTQKLYRILRKVVIGLVGASVVLVGIAMIVLPGPAILVIPAGVAILGTEFLWAKRLLGRMKDSARWVVQRQRRALVAAPAVVQVTEAPSRS